MQEYTDEWSTGRGLHLVDKELARPEDILPTTMSLRYTLVAKTTHVDNGREVDNAILYDLFELLL